MAGAYAEGTDNTLADVAMYYYERDLHSLINEVPTTARDPVWDVANSI
jgi:type IV pilus assembly protein PilY1